ncbi:hypothetical protein L3i20_v209750 [Paenibacillus sp. L3-i20]|nr:hypothetical protein L3i20_v209750 [Paenibacillus sp. L3-i20]
MERDGLVSRKTYNQVPPKVEYSLTEFGESLKEALRDLYDWGGDYIKQQYPNGEVTIRNEIEDI